VVAAALLRFLIVACLSVFALGAAARGSPALDPVRWCGTDSVSTDRLPDLGGPSVHVIYAFPADGEDRFAQRVHQIVNDVAAIDVWWRRQDPTRAPRFDRFPFPGCTTKLGALDVSKVRLPQPAAYYAPDTMGIVTGRGRHQRLQEALNAEPFGFGSPAKKYLGFYDGPIADAGCAGGTIGAPATGGPLAYAWAYLGGCVDDLGSGQRYARIAAHELIHILGALPRPFPHPGPPHPCPDQTHVCDSSTDIIYGLGSATPLPTVVLDAGKDDYYGHSGPWWDVQDSPYLVAQVPLSVTVSSRAQGASGRIVSEPAGLECYETCTLGFDQGASVTLRPEPDAGVRLVAWGGACSGRERCSVRLDAPQSVTASFDRASFQVTVRLRGRGKVRSRPAGISCPARCTADFRSNAVVRLMATPAKGWRLAQWTGRCRGRGQCLLRTDADRSVGATFTRRP
jgi:hypothetical protein